MKHVLAISSAVLICVALVGCGSSKPAFTDNTSEPLETVAKNAAHDAVPKSQLTKDGESFLQFSNDNGNLSIDAEPTDNATKGLEKDETLQDTATVIKDLFTDPRVKDVKITWWTPADDGYGNTIAATVDTVEFTRANESKINWDSFDYHNIPNIADNFQWGANYQ